MRDDALGQSPTAKQSKAAVEPADWELFRILRRNLDFVTKENGQQLLAVTSAMAEEGKTTVASFVAFPTAATGKRVLLIECDLRRPVLAQRLDLNNSPGVTDFVLGNAEPGDILQTVGFDDPVSINGSKRKSVRRRSPRRAANVPARTNLHHGRVTYAASRRDARIRGLPGMLDQVRNAYDLVILDTPPVLSVVDALELIPKADSVLVCGRLARLTREQARAGKAALDRLPPRPTALVITGTKRGDEEYSGGYYGYYA